MSKTIARILILFALAVWPCTGVAKHRTVRIQGVLSDILKRPIAGALITVESRGITRTFHTGSEGEFDFTAPVGFCHLTIEARYFGKFDWKIMNLKDDLTDMELGLNQSLDAPERIVCVLWGDPKIKPINASPPTKIEARRIGQ